MRRHGGLNQCHCPSKILGWDWVDFSWQGGHFCHLQIWSLPPSGREEKLPGLWEALHKELGQGYPVKAKATSNLGSLHLGTPDSRVRDSG